jgi:hypothetical protein
MKNAEQPQKNDDRDRNADQPQENAAHGSALHSAKLGAMSEERLDQRVVPSP